MLHHCFGPRPAGPAARRTSVAALLSQAALLSRAALLAFVAGVALPVAPRAETNDYAKIILHIVPATGSMSCNSTKGKIACDNMKVAGNLNQPYYAFACVVDGDASKGIAGAEFGIEYNSSRSRGVDISDWNLCGTLQFAMDRWPASGTGLLVTWDAQNKCQREEPSGPGKGVTAVAGYFYLTAYTADKLSVTRRPVGSPPTAKVADCSGVEYTVDGFGANFSQSHLGFVNFSDGATVAGWNPCGLARPVVETSWGSIKSNASSNR